MTVKNRSKKISWAYSNQQMGQKSSNLEVILCLFLTWQRFYGTLEHKGQVGPNPFGSNWKITEKKKQFTDATVMPFLQKFEVIHRQSAIAVRIQALQSCGQSDKSPAGRLQQDPPSIFLPKWLNKQNTSCVEIRHIFSLGFQVCKLATKCGSRDSKNPLQILELIGFHPSTNDFFTWKSLPLILKVPSKGTLILSWRCIWHLHFAQLSVHNFWVSLVGNGLCAAQKPLNSCFAGREGSSVFLGGGLCWSCRCMVTLRYSNTARQENTDLNRSSNRNIWTSHM